MNRSQLLGGAIVALAVLTTAACGGDDDDDAASTSAPADVTTTSTSGTAGEFDDYVGLTVDEATAKAEADGRPSRVVEIDGEPQPATMDFIENRLNFAVEDGTVVEVTTG
jgi:hypothetical protein